MTAGDKFSVFKERYQRNHPTYTWAQQFIDGNNGAIGSAFIWESTPQGDEYWGKVATNRATPEEMEEARGFVRWLISPEVIDDNLD